MESPVAFMPPVPALGGGVRSIPLVRVVPRTGEAPIFSVRRRTSMICAPSSHTHRRPGSAEPRLHAELRAFMAASASATRNLSVHERRVAASTLPRRDDLLRAGRADLVRALRAAGGSRVVAREMGVLMGSCAVTDFEEEGESCLVDEIMRLVESEGIGKFPTRGQMQAFGRLDLIAGVRRYGGAGRVAALCGLKLQKGRYRGGGGREEGMKRLRKEFQRDDGTGRGGALPANRELLLGGRLDLVRDINASGGRQKVAEMLEVDMCDGTVFSEDLFDCEVCDSPDALEYSSEENRLAGEARGGGGGAVLDEGDGGCVQGGRRRKAHHYREFRVLEAELLAFIFDRGVHGMMPTAEELKQAKRRDLLRACSLHGGQKVVADRLGLARQSMGRKQVAETTIGLLKTSKRGVNFRVGTGERWRKSSGSTLDTKKVISIMG